MITAALLALSLVSPVADRDEEPLRALPGDDAPLHSPDALLADLDQVWEVLHRLHPGLHRFTEPTDLDRAFGAAAAQIDRPMDDLAFFRILSRLIAEIRCGHTRCQPSSRMRNTLNRDGVRLPFEVRFVGEEVFVSRVLGDGVFEDAVLEDAESGLEPGTKIVSIDGIPVAEVRSRMLASAPGDGFIETGRWRSVERAFARDHALYVDARSTSFQLEVLAPGSSAPAHVTVAGAPLQPSAADAAPLPLAFEIREDGVALLTIRTFGGGTIRGAGQDYAEFLESSFQRAREEGAKGLVVDIRGNGGGDDMYGAMLVSYFSPDVFRYFDSIEVTPDCEAQGETEMHADGRRLALSHTGLQEQSPATWTFEGPRALLVDGFTYSTAADVATVVHFNGLATLFGEESGGGYDGNTSGSSEGVSLDNSGLSVSVPLYMYTTANLGHERFGRGAPVDYGIEPAIEDVLAGRDPVLEAALRFVTAE